MAYIYALLLDTEFGVMDGLLPDMIGRCPGLLKASKGGGKGADPDLPILGQALNGSYREEFLQVMRNEIEELEAHGTWTVIERKPGMNVLPGTWAMRIKRYPDGRKKKVKARWCARGDRQIEGVDYHEKYAPVVSWTTVRLLLSLSIQQGWATKQADFSNAFVQATLKEDVYMELPQMFEAEGDNLILKLNKSLYGLVQSPMYWFEVLSGVFGGSGAQSK